MTDEELEDIKEELHYALRCLNNYQTEDGMYQETVDSLQLSLELLTGSRWVEKEIA
jgi:hypothetical protein